MLLSSSTFEPSAGTSTRRAGWSLSRLVRPRPHFLPEVPPSNNALDVTARVAEIKKAADRFTTGRLHLAWVIDGVYGLERNSPAVRFFASSDP